LDPVDFAKRLEALGAGEIVVNSIDRDGEMKGYDMDLVVQVREVISLPMTVLGGAGTLQDIEGLIRKFGIVGAAAGSLFVFKGKYRAVLINYPSASEKDALIARARAS
jgi:cyclase